MFYLYNNTLSVMVFNDIGLELPSHEYVGISESLKNSYFDGCSLDSYIDSGDLQVCKNETNNPPNIEDIFNAIQGKFILSKSTSAFEVNYDDTSTSLGVFNVQQAIEEVYTIANTGGSPDHSLLINRDIAGNHEKLIPSTDSTTAIQIMKADSLTSVMTIDTIDNKVSIKNIVLENNTSTNVDGVIYKGSNRFIHNFSYGNNGTVTPIGNNLFIGFEAGNFTMGSTATTSSQGSENLGIGSYSLNRMTTGGKNTAIGIYSMFFATQSTSVVSIGFASGYLTSTGSENVNIGDYSAYACSTGSRNVNIGKEAGRYLTTGSNNINIGAYSNTNAIDDTNSITIGDGAVGKGSNTAVLGNYNTLNTYLKGNVNLAKIKPEVDSATAIRFMKANGTTSLFTIDTINDKLLDKDGNEIGSGSSEIEGILGETVSIGQPCYQKESDSKWYLAQATDGMLSNLSICTLGGNLDDTGKFTKYTKLTSLTGLPDTKEVYVSQTVAGSLTDELYTTGIVAYIGLTESTTTLNVSIGLSGYTASALQEHNNLTGRDEPGNHSRIIPLSDSTEAFQIMKADGVTDLLNVDTTNDWIRFKSKGLGINTDKAGPYETSAVVNSRAFTVVGAGTDSAYSNGQLFLGNNRSTSALDGDECGGLFFFHDKLIPTNDSYKRTAYIISLLRDSGSVISSDLVFATKSTLEADPSPRMTIKGSGDIEDTGNLTFINIGDSDIRNIRGSFATVNTASSLGAIRFGGGDGANQRAFMQIAQEWNGSSTDTNISFVTTRGGVGSDVRATFNYTGIEVNGNIETLGVIQADTIRLNKYYNAVDNNSCSITWNANYGISSSGSTQFVNNSGSGGFGGFYFYDIRADVSSVTPSNLIFAVNYLGSAYIKNDLEVGGSIQAGGNVTVPNGDTVNGYYFMRNGTPLKAFWKASSNDNVFIDQQNNASLFIRTNTYGTPITSIRVRENGYVGIMSTSFPTEALDVNGNIKASGYTKLGSGSPAIKFKKISGISPAINTQTTLYHGLDYSKIIDMQITFHYDAGTGSNYGRYFGNSGTQCMVWVWYTEIGVKHTQGDMVGKPFTILITYEE